MNAFQRQLLIGGKSLAELVDLNGRKAAPGLDYYGGPLAPPQRVSAEEFERTMADLRACRKESQ